MTTLSFEKRLLKSANFNGESSLPPLALRLSGDRPGPKTELAEDDGFFVGYGEVSCPFPYKMQDMYDRALEEKAYTAAVLENDWLKATFLPELGGKMWSLIDKKAGKELLFSNDVVRPCNLAIRNAWTSGGVEWNMGVLGHSPFTCSLVNTARTALSDGTPVLRFYFYERIRDCIAQMDIFLPESSKVLYVRTRITNPNENMVPMYWWSNIATVQEPGARVIVPAEETYLSEKGVYRTASIPMYNGVDVTYPTRSPVAYDYFWKTQKESLKYICQLNEDGYGLATSSTDMLRGRKLFVWGDTQGGRRWMNYLTADDKSGSYNEIQVGLARTQLEYQPMPARTAWEWVETYGAMQADKAKVHGNWAEARQEVESVFARSITKASLEKILAETKEMAKNPAEIVMKADGWANLELQRRVFMGERDLMCAHLSFGDIGEEQAAWGKLLEEGTVGNHTPEEIPASYQLREQWLILLRNAVQEKDRENWYAWYLLGAAEAAKKNFAGAKIALERSLALTSSAWAYYVLAIVGKLEQDAQSYVQNMQAAYALRRDDLSLAREMFRCLYETENSEKTLELFESAVNPVQADPRCRLYYAYALVRDGNGEKAKEVLLDGGNGLVVPDIREGENITSNLWDLIQAQGEAGADEELPQKLDFRMSYNKAAKK